MKKLLLLCVTLCLSLVCSAQNSNIKFQGQVDAGAAFMAMGAGPTVDLTAGVLLYDHFYAGIETGLGSMISNVIVYSDYYAFVVTAFEGYIPLGVNMKGYFTKNTNLKPYFNCSLGGFFGVADLAGINGFRCQLGAGIDYKRFNFGIGYQVLAKGGAAHCGYVKLGCRF